ncbi:MAG TPA: HIG1 domain-containing protein [Burkholderiales bacterium]|nr:HIG1 domain-containing protein [Burkholderiales bacterium]
MDAVTFLIFVAAAMTVATLARGIASMARSGDYDQLHSHELMFQRTAWQGLAVLFLMLAIFAKS